MPPSDFLKIWVVPEASSRTTIWIRCPGGMPHDANMGLVATIAGSSQMITAPLKIRAKASGVKTREQFTPRLYIGTTALATVGYIWRSGKSS
jgi:hypothetical protein